MRIFGKEEVIHPADPEEGSRSESIEKRGIQILQDPIVPHGLQAGKREICLRFSAAFSPSMRQRIMRSG